MNAWIFRNNPNYYMSVYTIKKLGGIPCEKNISMHSNNYINYDKNLKEVCY